MRLAARRRRYVGFFHWRGSRDGAAYIRLGRKGSPTTLPRGGRIGSEARKVAGQPVTTLEPIPWPARSRWLMWSRTELHSARAWSSATCSAISAGNRGKVGNAKDHPPPIPRSRTGALSRRSAELSTVTPQRSGPMVS